MRTDYQQLMTDRDYLLRVGEMYYEVPEEIHQRSTSSVLVDNQMYQSVTLTEDVDDLAGEH
jgi:hypothetical protein